MNRAFFFDRDRTLIADAPPGLASHAAHAPEHVVLLPGAIEALRRVKAAGYLVLIVTNQPGPAKGQYSRAAVAATSTRFVALCSAAGAAIDAVYACEHHPEGGPAGDPSLICNCECRKPKPGLILRGARDWDVDMTRSAMVGDDIRDMLAAEAAGLRGYRVGPQGAPLLEAVDQALRDLELAPATAALP
jgi:D-glycero-D-manno-heptose 1,7-bisphosphate phosphatase